jgi:MFS family permease
MSNHDMADEAANPKGIQATTDVNMTECPVTWKAYLLCAFASFGGIFFGYDSGYVNGVLNSPLFIEEVEGPICPQGLDTPGGACAISSSNTSLIVSILSAGTFFGALIAGDLSDMIGRKWTIVLGCLIYIIGMKSPHALPC